MRVRKRLATFLREGLVSLGDGEERDENFSLWRGFIPNSSLILLKKETDNHKTECTFTVFQSIHVLIYASLQGVLGLLHRVVLGVILSVCIR